MEDKRKNVQHGGIAKIAVIAKIAKIEKQRQDGYSPPLKIRVDSKDAATGRRAAICA